jgi:hypothetical protein
MANNNINNLNVFTFIKDIYQSLKHIDKCFNDFNTNINTRMSKIEDNQQIMLDKLNNLEILLFKQGETNKFNQSLDKNLENSLLEKITKMNNMNTTNNDYKVELKPDELTFANVLENNYTFLDINSSLSENGLSKDLSKDLSKEFSSSSGSSYYNNKSTSSNSNISTENIENLNNLLF